MSRTFKRVLTGLVAVVGMSTTGLVATSTGAVAKTCEKERFGYTGQIKCGSHVKDCPWDEAFAIAPSGTVWHAWPNSGGWQHMPNGGTAADTHACYLNGNHYRQVEVVTAAGNIYYSYYDSGWRGWFLYP